MLWLHMLIADNVKEAIYDPRSRFLSIPYLD